MNLSKLSNQELWDQTQKLVTEERRLTTTILWHLQEVASRRLYLDRGFPNLFAYCVDGLGYTPGAASRRIKAMQLLRDLPMEAQKKVEANLNEGKISLSNMSALQYFFEKEKKHCARDFTQNEKIGLLRQIEGKAQEECQKILFSVSHNPEQTFLPRERERVVSENKTEIKFIADDRLLEKLRRIKELVAHQNPNPTYSELFCLMAEIVLKKIDPERRGACNLKKTMESKLQLKLQNEIQNNLKNISDEDTQTNLKTNLENHSAAEWSEVGVEAVGQNTGLNSKPSLFQENFSTTKTVTTPIMKARRSIPVAIKREVYKRDKGECAYHDLVTHKKCGCRYGLEYDHITPVACGGENTVENIRLRCKPHNWLEAKRIFGKQKMDAYLKGEL